MCRSTGTLPHSSFPLPVLISCPAPQSLHHSLCLWLIPLIRLIKQNVNLGQDWLRTGGWRGQDSDCCGDALMMSNGVWSRRWTFSQWAAGGRRGFNRIGLLHGADIVKKNLSIQLYSATLDMTGLIHIFGIKFLCYDWLLLFYGDVLAYISCQRTKQSNSVHFALLGRTSFKSQGLSGVFLLCLVSVPSKLMSPPWHWLFFYVSASDLCLVKQQQQGYSCYFPCLQLCTALPLCAEGIALILVYLTSQRYTWRFRPTLETEITSLCLKLDVLRHRDEKNCNHSVHTWQQ